MESGNILQSDLLVKRPYFMLRGDAIAVLLTCEGTLSPLQLHPGAPWVCPKKERVLFSVPPGSTNFLCANVILVHVLSLLHLFYLMHFAQHVSCCDISEWAGMEKASDDLQSLLVKHFQSPLISANSLKNVCETVYTILRPHTHSRY